MKVLVHMLALLPLVLAYADISEKERFDDLMSNPDLLKAHLYCYLEKGPCDEISTAHKKHLAEAVATACAQCTPTHRHNVRIFIKAVSQLFPELYHELRNRYDPDGTHYDVLIEKVQPY